MRPAIVLTGLALAATGSAVLNWLHWRDPAPPEAMAVIAPEGRQALDLLAAPDAAEVHGDAETGPLPGEPARYLVAENRDGRVVVGWSPSPEASPEAVVTVAEGATTFIAYVDRHRAGTAVVEAWRGWTRESGARRATITYRD